MLLLLSGAVLSAKRGTWSANAISSQQHPITRPLPRFRQQQTPSPSPSDPLLPSVLFQKNSWRPNAEWFIPRLTVAPSRRGRFFTIELTFGSGVLTDRERRRDRSGWWQNNSTQVLVIIKCLFLCESLAIMDPNKPVQYVYKTLRKMTSFRDSNWQSKSSCQSKSLQNASLTPLSRISHYHFRKVFIIHCQSWFVHEVRNCPECL